MKKVQLILLFVLGFVFAISAQPDPEKHEKRKEIRDKVHEYVKENIYPVIKAQRAKLETELSTAHKNRLAELRAELKPLHEQMRAKHKDMKEARKNGEERVENQDDEMREVHQKMRKIKLEAWTIADEYDDQIKALRDEVEPQKETWKSEMKAIVEANMTDEMRQKMEERHEKKGEKHHEKAECDKKEGEKSHGHHKGKGHHKGHHGKGLGMKKMMSPVRFILLDVNAEMPDFPVDSDDDKAKTEALIFPNPSKNANVVQFEVEQEGSVKIDLVNSNGEVVKTVLNETKKKGEHTVKADLQNLKTGVYHYQITTPSGTETKRFVIE